MLSAVSIARTSNVWAPSVSATLVNGELQGPNAAVSPRHSNVDPLSVDVNDHVGVVSLLGVGAATVIVVFGAVVSTVNVRAAVGPRLPAVSVWRTLNVCPLWESVALVYGDVQTAKFAVSMRHSNVAPASP